MGAGRGARPEELGTDDSDDRVGLVVEQDGLADNIRVGSVSTHPVYESEPAETFQCIPAAIYLCWVSRLRSFRTLTSRPVENLL